MLLQRTSQSQTSNKKKICLTWTNLQEFILCSKLISKVNHQKSVTQNNLLFYENLTNLKLKSQKIDLQLQDSRAFYSGNDNSQANVMCQFSKGVACTNLHGQVMLCFYKE